MAIETFKVLALGDTVGDPGRRAVQQILPALIKEAGIDFVILNGENMAGGSGITEQSVMSVFSAGVNVMTSGDHIFKKKEGIALLSNSSRLLKPANYPAGTPGIGATVVEAPNGKKVGVINLMGRVFLKTVDCPFQTALREVERLRAHTPIIFVDIHAEATSEKVALGWFLDGKVTAVFGTHTHVQTADETILPQGTGYLTDLGMCGPFKSVIGRQIEQVLHMFLTQMPTHLDVATDDPRISGAIFEVDPVTGKTLAIRRVHERVGTYAGAAAAK